MTILNAYRTDTIDLDPGEFLRMKTETPEQIELAQIILPKLGSREGFGKIRVKLSTPRYGVNL